LCPAPQWFHETKYDGFRLRIERYGERVRLITRGGHDWAKRYSWINRGSPCGSFGDVSTFSFYPNRHVTTGEGGMILTDDDALADRLSGLRNLCFQQLRFRRAVEC
jgi:hypothetical protein